MTIFILGNFVEPLDELESLEMYFSHSKAQNHWRVNSLSADFLSEYWSNIAPKSENQSPNKLLDTSEAVSFIANELLENATKYGYKLAKYKFCLGLYLQENFVRFYLTNLIDQDSAQKFQQLIQKLLHEDPRVLQLEQIQKNATSKTRGSGLGFLTMFNGYDAKLAWKFEEYSLQPDLLSVTTMVEIDI